MDKIKCDFDGCNKDSIGYMSRIHQGPFYCCDHEVRAEKVVAHLWNEYCEVERIGHQDKGSAYDER